MKRRALLANGLAAGISIATLPVRARQAGRIYRVGWLSPADETSVRSTLLKALRELGWIGGDNIVFDVRGAAGQLERLPALAAGLVAGNVDAIVAVAPAAIRAAKQATTRIPIVMAFWGGPDLVESGIVASYARPGGNVTGIHMLQIVLEAKRMELLHKAVPQARKVAVLVMDRRLAEPQLPPVVAVARQNGLELHVVATLESANGYDGAFEAIVRSGAQALLVMSSPRFTRDRKLIIALAARHRIPAVYDWGDTAREGGLMAYGASLDELERHVAGYLDKVLKGAPPGDLPIQQPTQFEFVVNLSTAKALGLTIPHALLLSANQVTQ